MTKQNTKTFPMVLTTVIIIMALGAVGFLLFKDTAPPTIAIGPDTAYLGKGAQVDITVSDPGSGLKSLVIVAIQDGKEIPLANKQYSGGIMQVDESVNPAKGQIKEGDFTIKVTAVDASLYPFGETGLATAEKSYSFDATPPRIYVKSHTNNLNQGGAGFMVYTLSEEAAETGIRLGERFYPAYLQPSSGGRYLYYCMFAHPWDTPVEEFKPLIEAQDRAGNSAKKAFNYHTNARTFRHDKIRLSDSFMEKTIPEFEGMIPDQGTSIEQYLYINNTMRKANRDKLVEFSRKTSPTILWSGTFSRLPNAANRARFADARDYLYQGKKVDYQTHLGLDLASIKHAAVPAGNEGSVVYADFLGIYGNVVVIDHGLGLQTLYAHLSSVTVQAGAPVSKGDTIGHTGTTGLAGGDHLHYGVTIGGTPVQPIEWWDAQWIKNNVTSKME